MAIVSVLKDTTPVALGLSDRQHWTVQDTFQLVQKRYGGTHVGRGRYHALLHAAGLSYQRVAKVYRHKPSAAVISNWQANAEKK